MWNYSSNSTDTITGNKAINLRGGGAILITPYGQTILTQANLASVKGLLEIPGIVPSTANLPTTYTDTAATDISEAADRTQTKNIADKLNNLISLLTTAGIISSAITVTSTGDVESATAGSTYDMYSLFNFANAPALDYDYTISPTDAGTIVSLSNPTYSSYGIQISSTYTGNIAVTATHKVLTDVTATTNIDNVTVATTTTDTTSTTDSSTTTTTSTS